MVAQAARPRASPGFELHDGALASLGCPRSGSSPACALHGRAVRAAPFAIRAVALTGFACGCYGARMRHSLAPGLALAAMLLALPARSAPDVTPLESTAGLSSGFGEFRDAHFHAGLDYSTNEEEGHPVRAVNDGWVERVRASGVG